MMIAKKSATKVIASALLLTFSFSNSITYSSSNLIPVENSALTSGRFHVATGKAAGVAAIRSELRRFAIENKKAPSLQFRSELRKINLATTNLTPAQELDVLYQVQNEIKKEMESPGYGALPMIAVISDQHGAITKFDQLIVDAIRRAIPGKLPADFKLDPDKRIHDQLAVHGIESKDLRDKIFFHNLGDFMDRGPYGVKVYLRSNELMDAKISDFVIGNHDLWMFMNLAGFHLPTYDGYNFYNYADAYDTQYRNIAEVMTQKHKDIPATRTKTWWAERLAEYTATAEKKQRERWAALDIEVGGEYDKDKRKKGAPSLYAAVAASIKGNKDQQSVWDRLRGYGTLALTDIYIGTRAVGLVSLKWWEDLERDFKAEFQKIKNAPGYDASLDQNQAWIRAIEIIDQIVPEVRQDLEDRLAKGEWWVRAFEALHYQNYTSPEWWAKDWVFHSGWGSAVLKELNEGVTDEHKKVTTANYLENRTLQQVAEFFKENFNLYVRDALGNHYMHAFLPVDQETGEFFFHYKGREYRGKGNQHSSVWEGLDQITRDIREGTGRELYDALFLVNSWYADNTTLAKVPTVFANIQKFGSEKLAEANGVTRLFTAHLPFHEFAKIPADKRKGVLEGFRTRLLYFTDHGMGEKFGARGGWISVDFQGGIQLHGFEHAKATEIKLAPRTVALNKDISAEETLFENPGLDREDYLKTTEAFVNARIAELEQFLITGGARSELRALSSDSTVTFEQLITDVNANRNNPKRLNGLTLEDGSQVRAFRDFDDYQRAFPNRASQIHAHWDRHYAVFEIRNAALNYVAYMAIHRLTKISSQSPILNGQWRATGGTRMLEYHSDADALIDALELADEMSFKNSGAGIDGLKIGGSKSAIRSDFSRGLVGDDTKRYAGYVEMRNSILASYANAIEKIGNLIGGGILTGQDMNISEADAELMFRHAPTSIVPYVAVNEGSRVPTHPTGVGIMAAIRAAVKKAFPNSPGIPGKVFAVQGAGGTGKEIIVPLLNEGAKVIVSDVDWKRLADVDFAIGAERVKELRKSGMYRSFTENQVSPGVYSRVIFNPLIKPDWMVGSIAGEMEIDHVDVFVPAARGPAITRQTLPLLIDAGVKVVAGSANNLLEDKGSDSNAMLKAGIIHVPDYIANAGGVTGVDGHLGHDSSDEAIAALIERRVSNILDGAQREGMTPQAFADRESRLFFEALERAPIPDAADPKRSELRSQATAQLVTVRLEAGKSLEDQLSEIQVPESGSFTLRFIPISRKQRTELENTGLVEQAFDYPQVLEQLRSLFLKNGIQSVTVNDANHEIDITFKEPQQFGDQTLTTLRLSTDDGMTITKVSKHLVRISNPDSWHDSHVLDALVTHIPGQLHLLDEPLVIGDEETRALIAEFLPNGSGERLVAQNEARSELRNDERPPISLASIRVGNIFHHSTHGFGIVHAKNASTVQIRFLNGSGGLKLPQDFTAASFSVLRDFRRATPDEIQAFPVRSELRKQNRLEIREDAKAGELANLWGKKTVNGKTLDVEETILWLAENIVGDVADALLNWKEMDRKANELISKGATPEEAYGFLTSDFIAKTIDENGNIAEKTAGQIYEGGINNFLLAMGEDVPVSSHRWAMNETKPAQPRSRRRGLVITGPAHDFGMLASQTNGADYGLSSSLQDFEDAAPEMSLRDIWIQAENLRKLYAGEFEGGAPYRHPTKRYGASDSEVSSGTKKVGDPKEYVMKVGLNKAPAPFPRLPGFHLSLPSVTINGKRIPGFVVILTLQLLNNFDNLVKNGFDVGFYVPKSKWPTDEFVWEKAAFLMEQKIGVPQGTIKFKVMHEQAPFSLSQFVNMWVVKSRTLITNVGRWDQNASFIRTFKKFNSMLFPDQRFAGMLTPRMTYYTIRNAFFNVLVGVLPEKVKIDPNKEVQLVEMTNALAEGGMAVQLKNMPKPDDSEEIVEEKLKLNKNSTADIRIDKIRERILGLFLYKKSNGQKILFDATRESWVATTDREYVRAGAEPFEILLNADGSTLEEILTPLQEFVDQNFKDAALREKYFAKFVELGILNSDGKIRVTEFTKEDLTKEKIDSPENWKRLMMPSKGERTIEGFVQEIFFSFDYDGQQVGGNNAAAVENPLDGNKYTGVLKAQYTGNRLMSDHATNEGNLWGLLTSLIHQQPFTKDGRWEDPTGTYPPIEVKAGDIITPDLAYQVWLRLKVFTDKRLDNFEAKRIPVNRSVANAAMEAVKRILVKTDENGNPIDQNGEVVPEDGTGRVIQPVQDIPYFSRILYTLNELYRTNRISETKRVLAAIFTEDRAVLVQEVERLARNKKSTRQAKELLTIHDYVHDVFDLREVFGVAKVASEFRSIGKYDFAKLQPLASSIVTQGNQVRRITEADSEIIWNALRGKGVLDGRGNVTKEFAALGIKADGLHFAEDNAKLGIPTAYVWFFNDIVSLLMSSQSVGARSELRNVSVILRPDGEESQILRPVFGRSELRQLELDGSLGIPDANRTAIADAVKARALQAVNPVDVAGFANAVANSDNQVLRVNQAAATTNSQTLEARVVLPKLTGELIDYAREVAAAQAGLPTVFIAETATHASAIRAVFGNSLPENVVIIDADDQLANLAGLFSDRRVTQIQFFGLGGVDRGVANEISAKIELPAQFIAVKSAQEFIGLLGIVERITTEIAAAVRTAVAA